MSFWHVDVGDTIKEGDDLVEMVTDKATFNVPSPATGTLVEIKAEEDELKTVGDLLAILEIEE